MKKDVKIYLLSHLSFLKFQFQDYISDAEIATFDWIRNSFTTKLIVCTLIITNVLSDTSLKMQLSNISSLILDEHAWHEQNEFVGRIRFAQVWIAVVATWKVIFWSQVNMKWEKGLVV